MYLETDSTDSIVKHQQVLNRAQSLFIGSPDWVSFYRSILGVEGIVRQVFRDPEELATFEKSREFDEIQHMLARLRENKEAPADENEPTRVITVRLPKCMHETLRAEAHEYQTSMNKLCISKLLQIVDEELVPSESNSNGKKEKSADAIEPATQQVG